MLRASELNGWSSPVAMARTYFDSNLADRNLLAYTVRPQLFENLCLSLGARPGVGQQMAYARHGVTQEARVIWQGHRIHRATLRNSELPICVECLEANVLPPKYFDHRLTYYCQRHGSLLIVRCPSCSQPLTWMRPGIGLCRCGFDLRRAKPSKASWSSWLRQQDSALLSALTSNDHVHCAADVAEALTTTLTFCGRDINEIDIHMMTAMALRSVSGAASSIADVIVSHEGLSGPALHARLALWPLLAVSDNLGRAIVNEVLDEVLRRTSTIRVGINWRSFTIPSAAAAEVLGLSYHAMIRMHATSMKYEHVPGTRRQVDPDWINRLLLEGADLTVRHGRPRAPILDEDGDPNAPYTIAQAAELCRVHPETIRFAIHRGFLDADGVSDTCRARYLISRATMETFNERYVFAGPLAHDYSAGRTSFAERLMARGATPVSGPTVDGGLGYAFARKDLVGIPLHELKNDKRYPTRTGRAKLGQRKGTAPGLPLETVVSVFSASYRQIGRLSKRNLLRRVESLARGVYFCEQSVEELKKALADPELMDVEEAAASLGLSVGEFHWRYVNTGLVSRTDLVLRRVIRR